MGRSALWQDPWWEDALLWTLTARDVLMQASRFLTDWRKFWDIWHQSELKRQSMSVGSEQEQCECLWVSWKPDCVSDFCWRSDSHSQADFILPSVTNREQQKTDDTRDPDGRRLCVSCCWLLVGVQGWVVHKGNVSSGSSRVRKGRFYNKCLKNRSSSSPNWEAVLSFQEAQKKWNQHCSSRILNYFILLGL